jgi:hypothetical protein
METHTKAILKEYLQLIIFYIGGFIQAYVQYY